MSNKLKCVIDATVQDLDLGVVPMVKFFNERGLKTKMSCEGHGKPSQSLFWISFDKSVTADDIVKFMDRHKTEFPIDNWFVSNGRFAERINLMMMGNIEREWMYVAANVDAANRDLRDWLSIEGGERKKRSLVLLKEFLELGYEQDEAERLALLADDFFETMPAISLEGALEFFDDKFNEAGDMSFLVLGGNE